MKRILLFMLITSLTGCQKKDVSPTLPTHEGLYRTWELMQVTYEGKTVSPEQYITTVTFPRDGDFRGNYPKDSFVWCCSPVAFEGSNEAIRFIWDTSNPGCALINCVLSPLFGDVTWQIKTLDATSLVLTNGKTVLVFAAQP